MWSERGQASVEWVGLVLLAALVLGALGATAVRVDGRPLGELIARRIGAPEVAGAERTGGLEIAGTGRTGGPAAEAGRAGGGAVSQEGAAGAAPVLSPRMRELLRRGARRGIAANGLACYLRRSTEPGDPNRVGDDIIDAVNCLNPVDGWTGELRADGGG